MISLLIFGVQNWRRWSLQLISFSAVHRFFFFFFLFCKTVMKLRERLYPMEEFGILTWLIVLSYSANYSCRLYWLNIPSIDILKIHRMDYGHEGKNISSKLIYCKWWNGDRVNRLTLTSSIGNYHIFSLRSTRLVQDIFLKWQSESLLWQFWKRNFKRLLSFPKWPFPPPNNYMLILKAFTMNLITVPLYPCWSCSIKKKMYCAAQNKNGVHYCRKFNEQAYLTILISRYSANNR